MKTRDVDRFSLALLLNACVLPGMGNYIIGERIKGVFISLASILCLFVPLLKYSVDVFKVLDQKFENPAEFASSLNAASTAFQRNKDLIIYCLGALVLLWLYGIIDILIKKRKRATDFQGDSDGMQ
jgi:hypothetical protein